MRVKKTGVSNRFTRLFSGTDCAPIWDFTVIVFMIVHTRSSERIFNPMRFTGDIFMIAASLILQKRLDKKRGVYRNMCLPFHIFI